MNQIEPKKILKAYEKPFKQNEQWKWSRKRKEKSWFEKICADDLEIFWTDGTQDFG